MRLLFEGDFYSRAAFIGEFTVLGVMASCSASDVEFFRRNI